MSPIFFQNISPGQIPVIPAKVRAATGTYKNQWTLSKPVSHIPIRTINAVDINCTLSAEDKVILLFIYLYAASAVAVSGTVGRISLFSPVM